MRAALLILAKDLKLRLRDRSVFLFALVVPLGLTVVLSLVFPDAEDFRLSAAVVDADGGDVAQGFVDGVLPSLVAEGLVDLEEVAGEAEGRRAVADGDLDAMWVIPAGFGDGVRAGSGGQVQVVVNADRPLSGEIARSIAERYTASLERAALAVATTAAAAGGQVEPEVFERIAATVAAGPPAVEVSDVLAADRQLDATSYLAAGMAVFFLFFTVQFGVTGLLEERDGGTLPRLLAAPIGASAVHAGKALGAAVLGLVSMSVLAVASSVLLGADWGHPFGVAILIAAGVAAALGVMAFVGSFARTAEQAGNLQSIVALVLGLLGGVFFPLGGGWLERVSVISPHGWFLRGLGDLAGEGTPAAVLPAAAAMIAFGAVAAALGILRLRRAQP